MINNINEAVAYLKNAIENNTSALRVVDNFPGTAAGYPLQSSAVVVGVKSAKIPFTGCYFLGKDEKNNTYYGTMAELTFSLKICLPKTENGADCYPICDDIMYACSKCSQFKLLYFGLGKMEFHRLLGAITLDAELKVTLPFTTFVESGMGEITG